MVNGVLGAAVVSGQWSMGEAFWRPLGELNSLAFPGMFCAISVMM